MKRRNLIIMLALMLAMPFSAYAQVLKGTAMLNGQTIDAEYTKLSANTVALGSGFNACVSQYSVGRLAIPAYVKIDGTYYNVTAVSDMAFRFCNKLTFVELLGAVERIGNFAFVGCTSLEDVVLPKTVQSIGSGAFRDVPLVNVYCAATTPPVWEYNDVFRFKDGGIGDDDTQTIGSRVHVIVPESAVNNYKNALYDNASLGWTTPDGWGRFTDYNGDYLRNFRIYSGDDLETLQKFMKSATQAEQIKRISLEADVDMTKRLIWTTGLSNHTNAFAGTFDGNNHTIRGLQVYADEGYAGLFSAFNGDTIRNLRLEDCRFEGVVGAGAVCGTVLSHYEPVIENVYANAQVNSIADVGGLVGRVSSGDLTVNNCVFEGSVGLRYTELDDSNPARTVGGIVGYLMHGRIMNSAVIASSSSIAANTKYGPFIGAAIDPFSSPSTIQNSYYTGTDFPNYNPDPQTDHIYLYSNVVLGGRDTYDFHVGDNVYHNAYDYTKMMSFSLVPRLGLTKWVYKNGKHPLPATMEDRWPVEKNVFTLRPANMPTARVNGLTPLEDIPEAAWHSRDFTGANRDFHTYSFETSRLWFDETIKPDILDSPGIIPLGIASITATDGIEYAREIRAKDIGKKTHEEPLYEMDGDGNLIPTGESFTVNEGRDFQAVGYSVYLPFATTLPDVCKVYQPYDVSADGDATMIKFRQVEGNAVEAFTPYYVLVQSDTIVLSTEAETVCPPVSESNNIQLNGYTFVGTAQPISNYVAFLQNAYILQSDGKWHRVVNDADASHLNATIPAFRAYFRASSSNAKALSMMFDDGDTATGVVTIQTTDLDGTERYFDLSGRQLPGKPAHGIYILNGRKYLAE